MAGIEEEDCGIVRVEFDKLRQVCTKRMRKKRIRQILYVFHILHLRLSKFVKFWREKARVDKIK